MRQQQQRLKPRCYDEPVMRELRKLWELLNYSCGKRLVAIMPELIAKLEQFGELRLSPSSREKLLRISAATVDRLLQPERRKQQLRRRSHTKPGTLLKHQIPIRTFAEWDEQQPSECWSSCRNQSDRERVFRSSLLNERANKC